MCSVEPLREFIRERLTAAAEEIFTQLEKTIVRYEEEIDRQRRLLDLSWTRTEQNPAGRETRTEQNPAELQHHFSSDELPADRDSSSNPDRDAPEPGPDDVCSRQDGALVLKQETEAIMVTVDYDDEPEPSSYRLLYQNRPETQKRNQEALKPKKIRAPSDRPDLLPQNTDGNLYPCPICGKCFAKNSYLTKHKRIHTSEKPFVCDQCGKAFSNTSYLANHKKTHSGMKPFACLICGKVFTQQIHVTDHMRIHTGEKPFPCATCGKHFRQKSSLNKHLRTQHQKLEA